MVTLFACEHLHDSDCLSLNSNDTMRFTETNVPGAYIISLEPKRDERGFFARAWCEQELQAQGLCAQVVQCNVGFSERKGTVRGIHWQNPPHEEVKVVRCTRGGIFDVIVDLRPGSPAFGQYHAIELWDDRHTLLYIPAGVGHGYQTLTDRAEIFYQASASFHGESSDGLCYNDPALDIVWPLDVSVIADRDLNWPAFESRTFASTTSAEAAP